MPPSAESGELRKRNGFGSLIQAFLREFEVPLGGLLIRRFCLQGRYKAPVKAIP
nr:MAG TPA: hypothetical protein [Caudoviricetes sp.]